MLCFFVLIFGSIFFHAQRLIENVRISPTAVKRSATSSKQAAVAGRKAAKNKLTKRAKPATELNLNEGNLSSSSLDDARAMLMFVTVYN